MIVKWTLRNFVIFWSKIFFISLWHGINFHLESTCTKSHLWFPGILVVLDQNPSSDVRFSQGKANQNFLDWLHYRKLKWTMIIVNDDSSSPSPSSSSSSSGDQSSVLGRPDLEQQGQELPLHALPLRQWRRALLLLEKVFLVWECLRKVLTESISALAGSTPRPPSSTRPRLSLLLTISTLCLWCTGAWCIHARSQIMLDVGFKAF